MGYKNVCLNCKRLESLGTDHSKFRTGTCPECSTQMHFVSHKFRPPKTNDKKSWDVAIYLIPKGFCYQTIRDENGVAAEYPTTMTGAKEFVAKYTPDKILQTVRRKHEIEKQIADLESREQNRDRDILIRKLKSELEALS